MAVHCHLLPDWFGQGVSKLRSLVVYVLLLDVSPHLQALMLNSVFVRVARGQYVLRALTGSIPQASPDGQQPERTTKPGPAPGTGSVGGLQVFPVLAEDLHVVAEERSYSVLLMGQPSMVNKLFIGACTLPLVASFA